MGERYNTTIYTVELEHPDLAIIAQLGERLRAGELVAFPTETVYGLGADATNAGAVRRIFAAKGRPNTDPLIVHIASPDILPAVTGKALDELPPSAQLLAQHFWPGPLTLILPRGPDIPDEVTAGLETVGVRFPSHPVARALIAAAGVPVAAPSANIFGHVSPTRADHVLADLDTRIPWILDAGLCPVGVESTILDVTHLPPVLMRPGGTPVEAIEGVIGTPVQRRPRSAVTGDESAPAPGMMLSHYAPRSRLIVFEGDDEAMVWHHVIAQVQSHAPAVRVGALVPADLVEAACSAGATKVADLGDAGDSAAAAQRLFAGLRALDDEGVDIIITGSPASDGLGLALRDRLWRAAGGVVRTISSRS
jgi:L-threonylcarbamoyladenylate synthase